MTDAPETDPTGLADAVLTMHGRLRRSLLASKSDDVTASQTAALGRLLRYGPATIADLARAEGVRPQSMGATVQALVDLGLAERQPDPTDGRRSIVSATAAGRDARQAAWAARNRELTERLATLPEADRRVVARAMDLLGPIVDP
ncbi:MarR family transcriptional regulator [Curtobacterium flaccumfaciens]|uniref:MarR family transcriptional regulator n=1 Tax=Curtobacterium poinsettiae TaxID=159612 RepID=A0A9Q9P9J3_9MICO|nr:MarR family transcriptional regulator [Curtobacterium flaccumfaciens]UXN26198.1 MarR family transcriptional regulator [Curtobacterium flaccumfaciens]UYC81040.1 MarR family transcriptional regulator [Curtobacterium flaccumfaciens pv. poinsettiae]